MSRVVSVFVSAVLLVALGLVAPASAGFGEWPVTGTVTDTSGNPIEGVRVSDGNKGVFTDSDGTYTIPEPLLNSFTLTASKSGYQSQHRSAHNIPCTDVGQLPCTGPVDFELKRIDE